MTSFFSSKHPSESGQSFLILMIAVGFLSASAAALYALLSPSLDTRREVETRTALEQWKAAITRYRSHNGGTGPTDLEDLLDTTSSCTFDAATGQLSGYCGPYLFSYFLSNDDLIRDAWGTLFSYNEGAGTLTSCGADLACGTGDDWSVTF